ncbi:MAG: glycosyltransferase family A protein [Candidatus Nanoarchaeia archaeon]|nr:glycosyltransferase family A protein [Candidatus Nanoarchaeia archaeon]
MALIDIVIVSYNRKSLLIEILEKLKQQTVKDFNVIISDDGSKDLINPNLYTFIKKYIWTFDFGYHRVARFNEGISYCQTNKVILLDDDTVPSGNHWLEFHCNNLDLYDVSRGVVKFLDGTYNTGSWFSTTNTGFRVDKLKSIGCLDINYSGTYGFEDLDMGKTIHKNNFKLSSFLPETECLHKGQMYKNGNRTDEIIGKNKKYFTEKWKCDWLKEFK